MKCKNLLIRKRKYKPYFYCKEFRKEIILLDCENCLKRNLVRNKGINKVSKKRIFVKKEIYDIVFERDRGLCQICSGKDIELHHIIYRSENKNLINEPNNCIMLCYKCHKLVHKNKYYWQEKLKKLVEEKINE